MKKLLLTTVAFTALFGGSAFADNFDGSLVTRGTSGIVFAPGVPFVTPMVSDRTARRRYVNSNESPIIGKGRISVVRNEPASSSTP